MNPPNKFVENLDNKELHIYFEAFIKDSRSFFCLMKQVRMEGFFSLYKPLKKTNTIRILIGIDTSKEISNISDTSATEIEEVTGQKIEEELVELEDNQENEENLRKFISLIESGTLQIKVYPVSNQKINTNLHIISFHDKPNEGKVLVGSTNFTQSSIVDKLEFNTELKSPEDYLFARDRFIKLWGEAVDVSKKYIEIIQERSWLNDKLTPYELYLKFLYEYFKEELGFPDEKGKRELPKNIEDYEYQRQAVVNAKKILQEYGGVFISDVVGLGKTFIAADLARQIGGRTLVLAPPVLLDKHDPGSWRSAIRHFHVEGECESIGKIFDLSEDEIEDYDNIIIDEAHRFRTEGGARYEKMAEICRGKKVILVTATPYNNYPKDLLNQIKLFQDIRSSTIPGLVDLDAFFSKLQNRLKNLDKQSEYEEYIRIVRENSQEIRERVLKHLMVRRTRAEIIKYFSEDLVRQKLSFPEVEAPKPIFYELNNEEDLAFTKTVKIITQELKYARYTPLLPKYYRGGAIEDVHSMELAQANMSKFMKIILIKRLESSFEAFRKTLDRFIGYYETFLRALENGSVYMSKKHIKKIFSFLEENNEEGLEEFLVAKGSDIDTYPAADFKEDFKNDLKNDLELLYELKEMWARIKHDPKIEEFIIKLKTDKVLIQNKLVIFTESKETSQYLDKILNEHFPGRVLCFTGASDEEARDKVKENFDEKSKIKKDDYRILVCTEVLAEGVNLHRSNVVINYDLPWNPTRMMQRVGRVNRVGTTFKTIYTFNFFPTAHSNLHLKLEETAKAKIGAFISLLGADARLLTENEPIEQHELFSLLTSKRTLLGEEEHASEESPLKYLQVIKNIRDKSPLLFAKIKNLPKKSRAGRKDARASGELLSYFRKGKVQKFFLAGQVEESKELDFVAAAKMLEADSRESGQKIPSIFYSLLIKNKEAFSKATKDELPAVKARGGRDRATLILKKLEAIKWIQLSESQEKTLDLLKEGLERGRIPSKTMRNILKVLKKTEGTPPLIIFFEIDNCIPRGLLRGHFVEAGDWEFSKREVILSEYFVI